MKGIMRVACKEVSLEPTNAVASVKIFKMYYMYDVVASVGRVV